MDDGRLGAVVILSFFGVLLLIVLSGYLVSRRIDYRHRKEVADINRHTCPHCGLVFNREAHR